MLASQKESVIPELLYTLDKEGITRLCSVYGGETIYIPTVEELGICLKSAICSYYILIQKRKWPWVIKKLGIEKSDLQMYKSYHQSWIESLPKHELKVLHDLEEKGEF